LTCEPQWSEKKIRLDVALKEISVTADEDLLSQVWLNLLHNAVNLRLRADQLKWRLPCAATKSMQHCRQRHRDRAGRPDPVFERFTKADKARTHATEGSGVGLSIG